MGRAGAILAGLLVGLVLAAPVAAKPTVLARSPYPIYGPLFITGKGVVWTDSHCVPVINCEIVEDDFSDAVQEATILRLGRRGRPNLVLGRTEQQYAASASHLAISLNQADLGSVTNDNSVIESPLGTLGLQVGTLTGKGRALYRCRYDVTDGSPTAPSPGLPQFTGPGFALSGSKVAVLEPACSPSRGSIVVRDLRNGQRTPVPAKAPDTRIEPVAMSGSFLLVNNPLANSVRELSVYNWRTGQRLYTVAPPTGHTLGWTSLQADGKLAAIAAPGRSDGRGCKDLNLGWYSPAQPSFHPLPARPCPNPPVLVGDRIVFGSGYPLPKADVFQPPTRIQSITLGGRVRTLARFGKTSATYELAADRERVVFGVRRCDQGNDLISVPYTGGSYRAPGTTCPVRLRRGQQRVRLIGKQLRLRFACPRGCLGEVAIPKEDLDVFPARIYRRTRGTAIARLEIPARLRRKARRQRGVALRLRIGWRNRATDIDHYRRTVRVFGP